MNDVIGQMCGFAYTHRAAFVPGESVKTHSSGFDDSSRVDWESKESQSHVPCSNVLRVRVRNDVIRMGILEC